MTRRISLSLKTPAPARNNSARSGRKFVTLGKRARISSTTLRGPYLPPEQWYEPQKPGAGGFWHGVRPGANGYRQVGSKDVVPGRLAHLPGGRRRPGKGV